MTLQIELNNEDIASIVCDYLNKKLNQSIDADDIRFDATIQDDGGGAKPAYIQMSITLED